MISNIDRPLWCPLWIVTLWNFKDAPLAHPIVDFPTKPAEIWAVKSVVNTWDLAPNLSRNSEKTLLVSPLYRIPGHQLGTEAEWSILINSLMPICSCIMTEIIFVWNYWIETSVEMTYGNLKILVSPLHKKPIFSQFFNGLLHFWFIIGTLVSVADRRIMINMIISM